MDDLFPIFQFIVIRARFVIVGWLLNTLHHLSDHLISTYLPRIAYFLFLPRCYEYGVCFHLKMSILQLAMMSIFLVRKNRIFPENILPNLFECRMITPMQSQCLQNQNDIVDWISFKYLIGYINFTNFVLLMIFRIFALFTVFDFRIAHLGSEIQFIEDMVDSSALCGEIGHMVTTLSVSSQFILQFYNFF